MRNIFLNSKVADSKVISPNFVWGFLASLCFFSANYSLIPVIPLYLKYIGLNLNEIGWVISAFSLTSIFFRILVGSLSAKYGSRTFMLIGALIFVTAHPLYLVAASIPWIMMVRIYHGSGTAAFATASSIFVSEISPKKRLAQAIGIFNTSISLAMGLGPSLAVLLMEGLPYSKLFFVPSLVSLISMLSVLQIKTPRSSDGLLNNRSFVRVLKDKHVLIPAITLVTSTFSLGVVMAFLPLYVLELPSCSLAQYFVTYSIALIFIRFLGGGFSDRFGRQRVIVPSVLAVFSSTLGLSLVDNFFTLMSCALLFGFGYGLAYPALNALVIDRVEASDRGAALGIFTASVDGGFFLGPFIMGMVSQWLGLRFMFMLTATVPLSGVMFFCYVFTRIRQTEQSLNDKSVICNKGGLGD